jgi:hypothetical protein
MSAASDAVANTAKSVKCRFIGASRESRRVRDGRYHDQGSGIRDRGIEDQKATRKGHMTRQQMIRMLRLTLVFLAGSAARSDAQMFVPTGRDTLRGLPGIEVVVEGLAPETERDGLTRTAIHDDVTARLRAGGIPLYASQMENASPAKAYLYVHVNVLKLSPETYAVAIQVHVRQTVRSVATVSQIVNAMTWDTHNIIGVPAKQLRNARAEVLDYVDLFISDWAAVH